MPVAVARPRAEAALSPAQADIAPEAEPMVESFNRITGSLSCYSLSRVPSPDTPGSYQVTFDSAPSRLYERGPSRLAKDVSSADFDTLVGRLRLCEECGGDADPLYAAEARSQFTRLFSEAAKTDDMSQLLAQSDLGRFKRG